MRVAIVFTLCLIPGPLTESAYAQDADTTANDVQQAELISADEAAVLEEAMNDAPAAGRTPFIRFTGISTRGGASRTHDSRVKMQIRMPLGERMAAAVAMERDPGEPIIWKPSRGWYGPDHVAGYVSYSRDSPDYDLNAVAGRYRATFGHGALTGSGTRPIRSAGRVGVSPKLRADVRGYAGYSERPAPVGFATSVDLSSGFGIGSFLSRERLTASIARNSGGSITVRDVSTSGLHVGPSALSRRGQIAHSLVGGWGVFHTNQFSVGVLVGHSSIASPIRLTESVRGAAGSFATVAGSIHLRSCEVSGEAVLNPGFLVDVVGRCRTKTGSVFSEWTRETVGPTSLYGRIGRFVRDAPSVDVLRAGWRRRLVSQGRPLRARLAVTGTMTRFLRNSDHDMSGPISSMTPSGRLRVRARAEHEPFEASISLKVQRRFEEVESPFRLPGEKESSSSIITGFEERSAGFGSAVGVELAPGTFVRFGHLRSSSSGTPRAEAGSAVRWIAGTSVSLEVDRRLAHVALGVLSVDASECDSAGCDQLTSPRIYVYERGVQNAFGLASAGDDGIRWVLTAAVAPAGPVTFEAQIRHRADYHAEMDEMRAARIGAPPAATTATVQLTIR